MLVGAGVRAEDVSGPASSAPPPGTEIRKIEGIFGSDLPVTEPKGSVRLIVHPHVGDLTNRDYLRILTGFRAGVTDHLELSAGIESYLDHGLKRTSEGNGLGDVRFGGKYTFGERLVPGYETSVGFNVLLPVDHPPVGMTNGHNDYSPYFVIGRRIDRYPGLTLFLNTGLTILQNTSIPGSFERNDLHSNSISLTPGLVYEHYPYHYTLEFSYETTAVIGQDNKNVVTIRPGFAWDLPPWLKFHSKGRVIVAVGLHVSYGPDGVSTGGGGKLRAEFGVSRWFRRDRRDGGLAAPARN